MLQSLCRAGAVMALALAALAPFAAATRAEPFKLITTDVNAQLVPNSVMDLAVDLGYFEREGVEVELVRVQQTPSAVAALQAGEGDMANISVDAALQLVARDQIDLKAVVSPNKSLPFLIAGKEEIASLADLPANSFGVGRIGSLDHTLSSEVLATKGVDPGALEFVTIGQPNVRAQALAAGQIDATTMSIGVWLSIPDKTGLHVLIIAGGLLRRGAGAEQGQRGARFGAGGEARPGDGGGARARQGFARLLAGTAALGGRDGVRPAGRRPGDAGRAGPHLRRELERQRRAEPRRGRGDRGVDLRNARTSPGCARSASTSGWTSASSARCWTAKASRPR